MSRRTLLIALILTLVAGSFTFLATIQLSRAGTLVKTDGLAYFLYARSIVVDGDTNITNEFETLDAAFPVDYNNMMVALRKHARRHPQTQRIVVPWPIGAGVLMTPFYALGYGAETIVANATNRPVDTYGLIPQFFYGVGSLFYGFLGFWATFLCCRRVVLKNAAEDSSEKPEPLSPWLASLATLFAGSAAFYIFISPSMSHAVSLGFSSFLLLVWWRRWDGEAEGIALPGFLLGVLMTLRYQNTMFFPLLVALVLRQAWRKSFRSAVKQAAIGIGALLLPVSLQVMHYFTQHGWSGHGVGLLSGGGFKAEQNEISVIPYRFFDILFSCLHGAFYWTPVLALGFLGLLWAAYRKSWARVMLLTFVAHVYLLGALADGTAGHSFGMRYLIECSPILAVGLTVLLLASRPHLPQKAWLPSWLVIFFPLLFFNGLLILAFGAGTISGTGCVTYSEMWHGIGAALTQIFSG